MLKALPGHAALTAGEWGLADRFVLDGPAEVVS